MGEMWGDFSGLERFFFLSAVGGGTLFVFWMALQFIGGFDHGGDADVGDVDVGDVDAPHGDAHGSVDPGFKVISFQGLSSFFTMFGLVGLALSQGGANKFYSTLGGLVAGGFMLYAMARLFGFFKGLQSSGTLDMSNAVGAEGTVYLKIPADGTGKVQVTVQGRLMIFDAVSERKEEIPTDARIKVARVVSGDKLVVVKM